MQIQSGNRAGRSAGITGVTGDDSHRFNLELVDRYTNVLRLFDFQTRAPKGESTAQGWFI
jgi:hypothetical protein